MRRRLFRHSAAPARDGLDVGALAPMVDMMTLLLVFLLRTWSTESAPTPPSGAFELAGTTSVDSRQPATEIIVSSEGVWINSHRVTATRALAPAPASTPAPAAATPEGLIREIYDPLLQARVKDRVEIHADAEINYGILKRIISTCEAAGFDEIALVGVSAEGM
jgi:biopolymer transport protein ExbD